LRGEVADGGHVVGKEEEAEEEPEAVSFEEARGGAAVVGKEGDLMAVGIFWGALALHVAGEVFHEEEAEEGR